MKKDKSIDKNTHTPKVSVIISVCNTEKYLRECMDSVRGQTLDDIEIICVDDKSDDNSLSILHEYQSIDSRFIILENSERKGAAETRNRGIGIARGECLSILDSDDIFEKDMLSVAYTALMNSGADICGYDFLEFDDCTGQVVRRVNQPVFEILQASGHELKEGEILEINEIDDCFRILYLGGAWQKLYRRRFVVGNALEFQTLPNANDTYFCSATCAIAQRMVYIHSPMVHYRINRKGQTIGKKNKYPLSLYSAFTHLYDQLSSLDRFGQIRSEYSSIAIQTLTGFMVEMTDEACETLFRHMVDDGLTSLGIDDVREEYFRYWRDYWLAVQLLGSDTAGEFLSFARDGQRYWRDRRKWCFSELKNSQLTIALWGYGEMGRKWIEEAGEYELNIAAVIDEDVTKQGLVTGNLEVISFADWPSDVDLIVVASPKFFGEILDRLRLSDKNMPVMDFHNFVYSNKRLEEAFDR